MLHKIGPVLWLVVGVSFILVGYQNCDFLGEGLEPYSSENSLGLGDNDGSGGGDIDDGGDPTTPGSSTIFGVSELGTVLGCAQRMDFPDEILTVTFYVNGAAGVGERIGEAFADGEQPGANCSGHRFEFQIPDYYRDGAVHQLYAYAGSESPENLIDLGPRSFAAYDFSEEGRSYFNSMLSSTLRSNCSSCHSENGRSAVLVYDYEVAFGYLLRPSPFNGGTSNSNSLISQINGDKSHAGGNFCGGGSTVCNLIKSWWAVEFE